MTRWEFKKRAQIIRIRARATRELYFEREWPHDLASFLSHGVWALAVSAEIRMVLREPQFYDATAQVVQVVGKDVDISVNGEELENDAE